MREQSNFNPEHAMPTRKGNAERPEAQKLGRTVHSMDGTFPGNTEYLTAGGEHELPSGTEHHNLTKAGRAAVDMREFNLPKPNQPDSIENEAA